MARGIFLLWFLAACSSNEELEFASLPDASVGPVPTPVVAPLVPGHVGQVRVAGVAPNRLIYVVGGPGVGAGPCPAALNGACLDVVGAILLGSTRANSNGVAILEFPVPASLPLGAEVGIQALSVGSSVEMSVAVGTEIRDPSDLCDRTDSTYADVECDLLTRINDFRASSQTCGSQNWPAAVPLLMDGDLRLASRTHAEWMRVNAFGHASPNGPLGDGFGERATTVGYDWRSLWENIGRGHNTPAALMNDWTTSTSHCRNMMRGTALDVGIGRAGSSAEPHWVTMFGQPR